MPDEAGNLLPGDEGYVPQPEENEPDAIGPETEPIIEDDAVSEQPVVLGNETEPFTDHAETIDGPYSGHNEFYHGSAVVNPENPLATVSDENWAVDVNRENR